MLHLNPKSLYVVHYRTHHMKVISAKNKQWHYARIPCIPPRDQHQVDPNVHDGFVQPLFFLACVNALFWVSFQLSACNSTVSLAFKNKERCQQLTACCYSYCKRCTLRITCRRSHIDRLKVPSYPECNWRERSRVLGSDPY